MNKIEDPAQLFETFLKTRDPDLREELILRHVPLVHYTLGRMGISSNLGVEYEDLVNQGLLGLIDAVDRFSPHHGAQFSTYAILRIRGKVLDYLRTQDWLSRTGRQRARMVQNAITELWTKLQRAPSEEELAEHLNLSPDQIQQALFDSGRLILSLDMSVEGEGDSESYSLYEILVDEDQPSPAEKLDEEELLARLVAAIKNLPEREQQILALYYYENLTLREIGELLGISESRVCQIHARAILSLRAMLQNPEIPVTPAGTSKAVTRAPESLSSHGELTNRSIFI